MEIPSSLAWVRRVRVGSDNAPKIEGVRSALAAYVPGVEVQGLEVPSGVPEQPIGLAAIARGARHRAESALRSGPCDLAVGLEDGLVVFQDLGGEVLNLGCAALFDGTRMSIGLSSAFAYPPECSEPALAGEPIGALFDRLFAARRAAVSPEATGEDIGNIGKLTLGRLPRAEYARQAVLCALVRFLNPDLYFEAGVPE